MIAILYRFFCFLGIHLPLPVSYFIARRIAELRYIFLPSLRRIMRKNMKVVLKYREKIYGEKFDYSLLKEKVKQTYYYFAKYMVDFFNLPKWERKDVERKVKVENISYLDEALSYGNGVIVLTAHLGNWELAGVVTSLLGYKINAIAIPYRGPSITRIYKKRREEKGVKVILTGENPKKILKALKSNEIVAILGDRLFTEKGMEVEFMGRKTYFPRGPATLAVKTKAKFLPGFLVMEGNSYRLFFGKIIEVPENMEEKEKIRYLVEKGAKEIEKNVLLYPEQWLNFSPMWD